MAIINKFRYMSSLCLIKYGRIMCQSCIDICSFTAVWTVRRMDTYLCIQYIHVLFYFKIMITLHPLKCMHYDVCYKCNNWLTPRLMEPGDSMLHSQGLPITPILSRINQIPRIDTYFLKIHSNIVLPSMPRPS